MPFFENEWVVPEELKFDLEDINKVLFITSKDFREPTFDEVAKLLKSKDVKYGFLSVRWLHNNIIPDITRYFYRIEIWSKFKNEKTV